MAFKLNRADAFGFALGVHATVGQVVLMREALALSGGNELSVGLGFAFWLTGVGLGALLAGAISKPKGAVIAGAVASPFFLIACLYELRLHRELIDLLPGIDPSLGQLAALLSVGLGAGGLTVGFLFTSAARSSSAEERTPVSRLYTAEAVGALAGGLIFTFLMAGKVSHLAAVAVVGCLPACVLAIDESARAVRASLGTMCLLMVLAAASGLLGRLDAQAQERAFSFFGAEGELVAAKDSRYSRLTLGRAEDEYHLFVDGRLDHAFPNPWERPVLIHTALTEHPNPQSVLIVGGGPSDRLEAALAHNPKKVVLTYLDEEAHRLCRPFWSPATSSALDDPRVTVVRDDGRRYVSNTSEKFDVVIVSARPPLSGQANRYHTLDFFEAVSRILKKGGSVTSLASGGANVLAPEAAKATAAELATVKSVFSEAVVVPGLQVMIHASADRGIVTDDAEVLKNRFLARGVKARSFSYRRFEEMLDPERTAELSRQLEIWPKVANTDFRPIVYLAGLQLWERGLVGTRSADDPTWTGAAEEWAWVWLVVPLALWLLWKALAIVRKRGGAGDSIFSITTTGAAGMAVEIVVMFVFQSVSGTLYAGLALLVALFMAGLAGGAYVGRRLLASGELSQGILVDIAVLGFLVLTGPVLGTFQESEALVASWSFVAGAVTGLAFPALIGLAAKSSSSDERKAASAMEAADHFGAALGALITGVVWIPVFGVYATCLLFACFKLASLAGLAAKKMIKL